MNLFVAADKYNLPSLKTSCVLSLTAEMTVENAVDILVLADLHRSEELKVAAKKLIVEKSGDMVRQEGWFQKLTAFPELHKEMFKTQCATFQSIRTISIQYVSD